MDNVRTIASIGISIALLACGMPAWATTSSVVAAPVRLADQPSAQRVSLAEGSPGGLHETDHARTESAAVGAGVIGKVDEPAPSHTDSFVLLGMGIVLVGVVARQRRRFSRSGTILSR